MSEKEQDRQEILRALDFVIIDLGQARKDLAECEPEKLGIGTRSNLKRLVQEIKGIASEFYAATPQP